MTDPESTPAHDASDAIRRANRRVVVIALVAAVLFIALVVAGGAWVVHEVSVIRAGQIENTRTAACQNRSLDNTLYDAKLALSGDRKAADYKPIPQC
jgi:hypothetical protein